MPKDKNSIEKRRYIFDVALKTYGEKTQCMMAMEEAGEFIQQVSKYARGNGDMDKLTEEIADLEIMIEQIKQNAGVNLFKLVEAKGRKIKRLYKKLGEDYE